jgi:hypothetical protein
VGHPVLFVLGCAVIALIRYQNSGIDHLKKKCKLGKEAVIVLCRAAQFWHQAAPWFTLGNQDVYEIFRYTVGVSM